MTPATIDRQPKNEAQVKYETEFLIEQISFRFKYFGARILSRRSHTVHTFAEKMEGEAKGLKNLPLLAIFQTPSWNPLLPTYSPATHFLQSSPSDIYALVRDWKYQATRAEENTIPCLQ